MGVDAEIAGVNWHAIWALARVFLPLSFVTIGGGNSILAEVEHQSIGVHHWVTPSQFLDFFAISRATPGPNSLFVVLIGYHVAGIAGALSSALALFVPTSVLLIVIARFWRRHGETEWLRAIERGLAPIAAGLVLAGTLSVLRVAEGGVLAWIVAAGAFVALRWLRANPFVLLAAGGVLFLIASTMMRI
jgi:chromate transporter